MTLVIVAGSGRGGGVGVGADFGCCCWRKKV